MSSSARVLSPSIQQREILQLTARYHVLFDGVKMGRCLGPNGKARWSYGRRHDGTVYANRAAEPPETPVALESL